MGLNNKYRKKKILVIDDEKYFTELIKMNLEGTGKYEVRTENKGSAGVDSAREFNPDLILLDILMPDMGGDEVAVELSEDELTKNIPIAFLTVLVKGQEVESSGGVISGRRFIAKPVSTVKLVDIIEEVLGKKSK